MLHRMVYATLTAAVVLAVFFFPYLNGDRGGNMNGVGGNLYGARQAMVTEQIKARGISDPRVLRAMLEVPRHEFVPADLADEAYADKPLAIGLGQTISQPYIVAYMTEKLELAPGDKVLEIGTGSGYQAAVLASLGAEVYSVEIICALEKQASERLARMGYTWVRTRCADGWKGWPEKAPFKGIILTAAPDRIPAALTDQLAEGGRLIAPVGGRLGQDLVLVRKEKGKLKEETLLAVAFVRMTGGERQER
ncbi:MAG: protein-L-isoaspartate(D-aspartate) O-methyltransferase [Elusimicrobia bacterium]|nr:protein-L-isoaspartate(D-aspartate) O-methyltransferase [Elusimicrobiota bacterium]